MKIPVPNEFNFNECIQFLDRSPLECLHTVENQRVFKLLRIKNKFILLSIFQNNPHEICIESLNKDISVRKDSAAANEIHKFITEWLDLDRDLRPFYAIAENSIILKNLIQQYYGLRLIGIPDLWEALCWSIIGQQINLQFAYTLKKRLVESYGHRFGHNGKTFWHFPDPAQIAELHPGELKALQFSRQKAEYAIDIARQICDGNISKSRLQSIDNIEDRRSVLMELRGVGAWTADYVLMKCLRQPSAFPIADVGLHNAIKRQLNLPQKPSIEEIQKMAEGWKNWEAYATFYLWRSLYE